MPTPIDEDYVPTYVNNRRDPTQSMARQLDALANRRVRFPQQGWGYQLMQLQKRAGQRAQAIVGEYIPRGVDSFKEALRAYMRKTSTVGRGRKARRPLLSSREIEQQIQQASLKRALHVAQVEEGRKVRANQASESLRRSAERAQQRVRVLEQKADRVLGRGATGAGAIHSIPGIAGRLGGITDVVAQDATNWAYWLGVEVVERRARIGAGGRATNRTGAAAAAVVRPVGTAGRRGGDRGVPVTVASPVSSPIATPVVPGKPGHGTGATAAARAAGKLSPGVNPVRSSSAPQTTRGQVGGRSVPAPANVQFRWSRPADVLLQALLSRPGARPAGRAVQVAQSAPMPSGQASSDAQALTGLNSGMSGFVPPETPTDRCNCEPKRKKRKESSCRNPVVSRTTSGNIRTTKVRLVCQQSKRK